jgi:hypothetical protein
VTLKDSFCSECGAPTGDGVKDRNVTKQSGTNLYSEKTPNANTNTDGWKSHYSLQVWIASVVVSLILFPFGLLVPTYFYFKGSRGTGVDQTPLEVWTVVLTSLIGIIAVETGGRKGAKAVWYIFVIILMIMFLLVMMLFLVV